MMLQLSSTEAQIALHAEEDSNHEAKHLIFNWEEAEDAEAIFACTQVLACTGSCNRVCRS